MPQCGDRGADKSEYVPVVFSTHGIYSLYIQTVIQTAIQTVVKTVQTIQTARGGVSSIDPFLRGLYGLYSFYNGLYHGLYHGLYVQTVP